MTAGSPPARFTRAAAAVACFRLTRWRRDRHRRRRSRRGDEGRVARIRCTGATHLRPGYRGGLVVGFLDRAGDHIEPLLEIRQPRKQPVAVAVQRLDRGRQPPRLEQIFLHLRFDLFCAAGEIVRGKLGPLRVDRQLPRQDAERQRADRGEAPQAEPPQGLPVELIFVRDDAAEPAVSIVGSEAVRQRIGFPCHNVLASPAIGRINP